MRLFALLPVTFLQAVCAEARDIEGRLRIGVCFSPGAQFRIGIPVLRNPFIRKPAQIREQRRDDGGEEVAFAVSEPGEACRYGAFPGAAGWRVRTPWPGHH